MPYRVGFAHAAVFTAPGAPLRIERLPIPGLAPGDVIVRIRCATICGSDLHSVMGRRKTLSPAVLGHEMTGEIAEMHPAGAYDLRGNRLSLGDRVTWSMLWTCGGCYYCSLGLSAHCERLRKFGHEAMGHGMDLFGGFAEYCWLPAGTAIARVPENLSDLAAAPANCATATVAAVVRAAGSLRRANVIVCGAGMLGLTACAMASWLGARMVIAIEPVGARREQAGEFGASLLLDPAQGAGDLLSRVAASTSGRGADIALEFSGSADACESLVALLRPGGHLVMAGSVFPSRPCSFDPEQIVRRMLRLTGVYNYRPEDLCRGLQFLSETISSFPFSSLVGATFALGDIDRAIAFAETAKPPRVALVPGKGSS
ncbi:MAG: zinc-binding dehydrogenase [Bryobacteraceae bacterium]